jgi:hypothetical protein
MRRRSTVLYPVIVWFEEGHFSNEAVIHISENVSKKQLLYVPQ